MFTASLLSRIFPHPKALRAVALAVAALGVSGCFQFEADPYKWHRALSPGDTTMPTQEWIANYFEKGESNYAENSIMIADSLVYDSRPLVSYKRGKKLAPDGAGCMRQAMKGQIIIAYVKNDNIVTGEDSAAFRLVEALKARLGPRYRDNVAVMPHYEAIRKQEEAADDGEPVPYVYVSSTTNQQYRDLAGEYAVYKMPFRALVFEPEKVDEFFGGR